MRSILVTGGAGFIGSHLVRHALKQVTTRVVNLDKLTYAGNLHLLADLADEPRHVFNQGDIADSDLVRSLLAEHRPAAVVNLAAETHVDRSIDEPARFVATNVVGTARLLETILQYWQTLGDQARTSFRFLHVSTDEVFGSLGDSGQFNEASPVAPNSPYAASKAAADHFVRAYHQTYGLPTLITNSSNNYGPGQFPEKLVPLAILAAINGQPIPLYGDGRQVRDWLHVEDHCQGLLATLERGAPGETYCFGGACEHTNLSLVEMVCHIVDQLQPNNAPAAARIRFVEDRPGHDRRYAMDASKAHDKLRWRPGRDFEAGLHDTVRWYFNNRAWISGIGSDDHRGERLGRRTAGGGRSETLP